MGNLIPRVPLIHLPCERRILHGLLWRLLVTVAHPGAAHFQRYDLLVLVFDDPGVYSIRSQFLKFPIDRNIPVSLCLRCFVDRLRFDGSIPWRICCFNLGFFILSPSWSSASPFLPYLLAGMYVEPQGCLPPFSTTILQSSIFISLNSVIGQCWVHLK